MPDSASIIINDYDGQQGAVTVNIPVVTAVNIADVLSDLDAIRQELPNIILGIVVSTGYSSRIQYVSSNAKATSNLAQRGNKWLFKCQDATVELAAGVPNPYFMRPFQYEIPTAKLALRIDNNNTVYVKDGTANVAQFDDFVPIWDSWAKSPVGGTLDTLSVEAITAAGG